MIRELRFKWYSLIFKVFYKSIFMAVFFVGIIEISWFLISSYDSFSFYKDFNYRPVILFFIFLLFFFSIEYDNILLDESNILSIDDLMRAVETYKISDELFRHYIFSYNKRNDYSNGVNVYNSFKKVGGVMVEKEADLVGVYENIRNNYIKSVGVYRVDNVIRLINTNIGIKKKDTFREY